MQEAKYYDYKNLRPIDLESDGCDLAEWDRLYGKVPFARHPKGYKIFLPPQKIVVSDEYADHDPYEVEKDTTGGFHKRRMDITVELAQEAVSQMQGVPRILDLGCGQGHITQKLHQKLASADLTGLDYSVSAIDYACEHFPGIDFAVGDAYEAPYAQGYFDLIVCNNLWEHVPDPLRLLSKMKEILKPNGYIIMSTPSRYRVYNLVRVLMGKPIIFMSPYHVTEYSVGQVIEQFAYGGFSMKRITSKPIPMGNLTLEAARTVFSTWVSLVHSHHQLESTVFYLAANNQVI